MSRSQQRVSDSQNNRARSWRAGGLAHIAAALVGFACIAGSSGSQAAGLVFSDGFESGNAKRWDSDGDRDRCTVVNTAHDGGAPHSGDWMLECNWNGTLPWNDHAWYSTMVLSQSAWKYSNEFLIRLWLRLDADVDHVNGDKLLRLYPHDDLESFFLAAQMDQAGGPIFVSWEKINGEDGPVSWGRGTQLGDTRWHKVEIYVKHNSREAKDGAVRVWLDSKLVQESTHIKTVADGKKWGPLHLMSNWSNNPGWAHDATNHVYWDDIEIYTDLGSGATGQMADATIGGGGPSPEPPQSVTVR
jgi:hypothetical protein